MRSPVSMPKPQRCVVYATPSHDVRAFAQAVAQAEGTWKPVAVTPLLLDAAIEALQPEAIVVATAQPRAGCVLRHTREVYGQRRVVIDDRNLSALTTLLSQAPQWSARVP